MRCTPSLPLGSAVCARKGVAHAHAVMRDVCVDTAKVRFRMILQYSTSVKNDTTTGTLSGGSSAPTSTTPSTGASAIALPPRAAAVQTVTEQPGEAEASDLTILNWNEALEHFGGEHDILCRLAKKFCDRAAPTLDSLRNAVQRGDMEALCREAHSLSGSCAYIGAVCLQAAALSLEEAASADGGAPARELISEGLVSIEKEQKRLLLAIKYHLSRGS